MNKKADKRTRIQDIFTELFAVFQEDIKLLPSYFFERSEKQGRKKS